MPIDPSQALGAELGEGQTSYTKDQVILYHLGVGAGQPATDPKELEYTYEKNLKVLPSFGVIPTFGSMGNIAKVPGMKFDFAMLLHGEQDLVVHQPIPPEATLTNKVRIAEIWDKRKAALVVLEVDSADESGEPLFTNRFSLFLRGEGGFGGESGPKVGNVAPEREPDGVVERPSLPQQALIYRLSGDKNPLHADPEFAKLAGFDTPITHGLCSYGIVCKAIVDDVLGGDVTKVARYQARFAGVAFPGETYVVSYWNEGDKIVFEAKSKERDAKIISNAAITVRS
ncbi:MAG: MaoC/PaaZ C-terminal domain-containing protein [Myxococcota bacterium]|jgi:acyl dehydratase|nr:3-alpha,7-alpha,12-alpha-trihydroxy-5-beta-cholest-24-enoyl-CoA hydratase [Deltaproteobacteria bacterium]MCP4241804.1 3-alpha,7-alpha,12-alpha-trihydroxy-5-beta-cholest-24-enoyl-CoA hydratase [bacterium]MDP6074153.1 MaoC/PaaZ C-terminal domain-containing protein [Myxococcota bacterium]MDP6241776.1 MaoC/PaaZ C-terminal domain-containing protein [Myxococcota bacterium]MDP7074588.1 MaoC/PaaZ C-terminal domain-containing protein [Myxococcota bacterium]